MLVLPEMPLQFREQFRHAARHAGKPFGRFPVAAAVGERLLEVVLADVSHETEKIAADSQWDAPPIHHDLDCRAFRPIAGLAQ